MLKSLVIISSLILSISSFAAVKPEPQDFKPLCDSITIRLKKHTGVYSKLNVERIVCHKESINLHFCRELAYYPWRSDDIQWFKEQLQELWPLAAQGYSLGKIYTQKYSLEELITPYIGNDGKSANFKGKISDPRKANKRFIQKPGSTAYPKGLDGRTIALWQSHGRYYNENQERWEWQRAIMHRTVEDMFTQSFVLPYLIPMLENAGAYTLTPRERDLNPLEYIIDNDPCFSGDRTLPIRQSGNYSETGSWTSAGSGFADTKPTYNFSDLPFSNGTARKSKCSGSKANSNAIWTAKIDSSGLYAVYISYKSLEHSCNSAHYSIHHKGGISEFTVDQSKGGGTWIYLGSFEFEAASTAKVVLDNRGNKSTYVSADAVKIGGGMAKLERDGRTSGLASAYEGAHYWMQWAGADTTITRNWDNDYTNDYASRGAWTKMLKEQKGIPIDLSLAFHSDAGLSPGDSLVGTLAIYTLRDEGKRSFADGRDRLDSRLLCDFVQTQVVEDIRAEFDPMWSRRGIWDKSYSECRTSGVPAMILELLSHQNFADMKHGLDPAFKFTASRAVYKGILKTLSAYYGCDYVVQPLPVHSFAARLSGDSVQLCWEPTEDSLEPTAGADAYFVHIRKGDGAFSTVVVKENKLELAIERGEIYSFKVEAYNAGGKSFPSELLSVGIPLAPVCDSSVLIVNNFDRVSAPSWVDTPTWAGFTANKDSGVPYMRDISYVGENFEFDRSQEYLNNYYPGFGASFEDKAGLIVAGNTFDYPYTHGKALMSVGYSFYSLSRDAFCAMEDNPAFIDIICGKQATTVIGRGAVEPRYAVFPLELQQAIQTYCRQGANIFISGANIASDCDSTAREFTAAVFGYGLSSPKATSAGLVENMPFSQVLNSNVYCVESPDALKAKRESAEVWLRYDSAPLAAAIYYKANLYRCISMGVPFEVLIKESDREKLMSEIMLRLRSKD